MNTPEARHLFIRGQVQGVGFRAAMVREAERLGITGWVRNRRDGTVEAQICGEAGSVAALLAWTRRGPRGASVSQVSVEIAAPDDAPGFLLAPDA